VSRSAETQAGFGENVAVVPAVMGLHDSVPVGRIEAGRGKRRGEGRRRRR
jgi:hypothetical protein